MTSSIRLALTLLLFLCLGAGVTPVLADGGNPYPPLCPSGPCFSMK
jgi:hypothetical protein